MLSRINRRRVTCGSIQQGGVASRPGHEYDAFLSRELGREIFNFGFAGNGVEEISVAQVWGGSAAPPCASSGRT